MSGRHRDEARNARTAGTRRAPAAALRWIVLGGGSIVALALFIAAAAVLFRHSGPKDDTAGTVPSTMASMLTAPSNPFEPSAPSPSSEPTQAKPSVKNPYRAPVVRTTPTRPDPPGADRPPVKPHPTRKPPAPVPTRTHCVLPSGLSCTPSPRL